MTSERGLWRTARRSLRPFARLVRLESSVGLGIPDVYYRLRNRDVAGWLELKELDRWPVRADTPIRIPSLTRQQASWLAEEWGAGGRAHLLLQVGPDYVLLEPATVLGIYRREVSRGGVEAAARVIGRGRFPTVPLVAHLTAARRRDA